MCHGEAVGTAGMARGPAGRALRFACGQGMAWGPAGGARGPVGMAQGTACGGEGAWGPAGGARGPAGNCVFCSLLLVSHLPQGQHF